MNEENSCKNIITGALLKKNPILVSGLVIAPAVVVADSFFGAAALAAAFSVITFFTLLVSSFVPKNLVYSVRIILYTVIGALVYVPSAILLNYLIPERIEAMGVFFPLLIANGLIISRSETIFFLESKGHMLLDIIFCIIGYDAAVLIFGAIREILGTGMIGGRIIGMPIMISGLRYPFGGFILLGMLSALLRVIFVLVRRFRQK